MIAKTRQASQAVRAEANEGALPVKSRGVLRLPAKSAGLRVSRHSPSPPLACCIAYYWRVGWDLRGAQPHLQETLPHPNIYLVFEESRLQISGVSTSKFVRILREQGFAFGVKFRPGGLRPFLHAPASSLTNRIVPANHVFATDGDELEATLNSCRTEREMVDAVDAFFLRRVPQPDPNVELADRLVGEILRQPQIRTVEDLATQTGLGKRSLQRLFRDYVGVPPKWVIRRYRLHELLDHLEARAEAFPQQSWSDLALQLGYFDQAHLINDFKAITGYSPANYFSNNTKASERNHHNV
jgi:AraC-like DNA-binding protein